MKAIFALTVLVIYSNATMFGPGGFASFGEGHGMPSFGGKSAEQMLEDARKQMEEYTI